MILPFESKDLVLYECQNQVNLNLLIYSLPPHKAITYNKKKLCTKWEGSCKGAKPHPPFFENQKK